MTPSPAIAPRRRPVRSWAAVAVTAGLIAAAVVPISDATAAATTDGLLVDYSFDQTGGASVPNLAPGSSFGAATVQNGVAGQWADGALTFTGGSNGNWVRLPDSLLRGKESATITTEVKIDASMKNTNHFLWNIGNSQNQTYWFSHAKDTPRTAITTGSGGGEVNARATDNLDADRWYSLTSVIDGAADQIRFYVDGRQVGSATTTLTPAAISDQSLNTIARSPWNDPYFKGAVSEFRVFDRALDAAEIAAISDADAKAHPEGDAERAQAVLAGLDDPTVISDPITTLPDLGGRVTWSTDTAGAAVDADGTTLRTTQPATGSAERAISLTATASVRGSTATRTVSGTVKPAVAATDPYGYLLVHFIEDAEGYAEKIYLDVSRGNNAEQWDPLNGGKPILASALGTTGVRDPFITQNPETKKYYIIATDLRVFGGDGRDYSQPCQDWCYWERNGSNNLIVWESDDLVTWSEPRSVNVAPPGGRLGMAWAPETTWVDDYNGTGKGSFVVYWSSRISEGGDNYSSGRILWGATTDFTQDTFTYGGTMLDEGGFTIDASILQHDGTTYRVAKDQRFGKNIYLDSTDSPTWWRGDTKWNRIQENVGREYGGVEGPAGFERNDADQWYLYVDVIPKIGYRPMTTTNLDAGFTPLESKTFFMTASTKHGGVLDLTKADYDRIRAADATGVTTGDLGDFDVTAGTDAAAALPTKTTVTTAYGRGEQQLPVVWDATGVDTSRNGSYEVTGVVQSIGANKNDWTGRDGSKLYDAPDRTAFSNTEITVSATVDVSGATPSPTPTATPTGTPPPDPLVAQYTFDNTANRGADSSGRGNHLTTFGSPAFGTPAGRDSAALQLSGANGQYAKLPDRVFSTVGNDFTMEFDARSGSSGNGFFTVGIGRDDHRYLLIKVDDNGGGRVAIATDGWRNEQGFSFTATPGWHTYRLVVEPGLIALFVDGELAGYKADVTMTMSDLQGSTAYVGRSFYGGDRYFTGDLDDISVWDGTELPVAITGLAIGGERVANGSVTVSNGRTTQLTGIGQPDGAPDAVRWSSSNSSVASVDANGMVTSKALGEATITATSVFDAGITATATVRVVSGGEIALKEDLRAAVAAVNTTTTENLPLLAKGSEFGSDITWTTTDGSVITGTGPVVDPGSALPDPFRGGGVISRAPYGDGDRTATIRATATLDGTTVMSDPIAVTVKEATRTAPDTNYAAVTMRGEPELKSQRVWVSSTDEANFFSFKTRNNGQPAVTGDADELGLRDHYIQKSVGGDKYYLMSTDLDTNAHGGNWGYFGSRGSLKLEVYESADLVHWKRTNGDGNGGIVVNAPTSGMTWAPESFWDEKLQSYVVFFSSTEFTDSSRNTAVPGKNGYGYTQLMAVLTRDFKTFTYPPVGWQDTGYGRLDAHVFQIGDYYYRLTKNEEGGSAGPYLPNGKMTFLERSKVLSSLTNETSPANDPNRTWQLLDENLLPFEGPASVKLLPNDPNNNAKKDGFVILSDGPDELANYRQRYLPFMTSESQLAATNWNNRLSQTPGWMTPKAPGPGVTGRVYADGMPEEDRHGVFFTIPQTVSDAVKNWTSVRAVSSTTAATYDPGTRVVSAKVTASDTGTLAGNVVFTLRDSTTSWSKTVKVVGGQARVVVPEGVAGTVAVAYDGYVADDLVDPSETTVTGITAAEDSSTPKVEAAASTRKIGGKVYITVTAVNRSAAPATVEIVTAYGSKAFTDVQPNAKVSAVFTSRSTSVPAGKAVVTATITSSGKKTSVDAPYAAQN